MVLAFKVEPSFNLQMQRIQPLTSLHHHHYYDYFSTGLSDGFGVNLYTCVYLWRYVQYILHVSQFL